MALNVGVGAIRTESDPNTFEVHITVVRTPYRIKSPNPRDTPPDIRDALRAWLDLTDD